MSKELNLFQSFLFEAPGDDPNTDIPPDETPMDTTGPPDVPTDADPNDGPPDISDEPPNPDEPLDDDAPPDMGDGGFEDDGLDEFDNSPSDEQQPNELDEKISSIMNMGLYQKFLNLLSNVNERITIIKDNTDIFFSLSNKSIEIIPSLKKLDENIRIYLKNSFVNERYEKNILFFNKCMNLYKLLGDKFNAQIAKGIKEHK